MRAIARRGEALAFSLGVLKVFDKISQNTFIGKSAVFRLEWDLLINIKFLKTDGE